ncbi:hypothetical protein [Photobacterium damselae]|uniref:hypothetical protein n=1 Tax=Photobacterium damselae TaxID=38293 RepID=UPI0040697BD4
MNSESIGYNQSALIEILDTTNLALVFTALDRKGSSSRFHSIQEVMREVCTGHDSCEFNIKNPNCGTNVTITWAGGLAIPSNSDAFNLLFTQIAGFNIHGEMFVLDTLIDNEVRMH